MDKDALDDILNGDDTQAPAAVQVETPEPMPDAGQPRNPNGTFAPKGDTPPPAMPDPEPTAPPAVKDEPAGLIPPKALQDERRKRQALEAEVAQMREAFARMQQPQPSAPQQPAAVPDMWEDPQGYADWVAAQAVERAVSQVQNVGQQFAGATRFDVSEMIARSKFEDYDEKLEVFADLARENPALAQRLQADPDPAGFAYRYAKNALEVQQLGSLDIDAIKAAAKAEALRELQAQTPAPVPTIPATLADAQSARTSMQAPQAPPTLDEIIRRRP